MVKRKASPAYLKPWPLPVILMTPLINFILPVLFFVSLGTIIYAIANNAFKQLEVDVAAISCGSHISYGWGRTLGPDLSTNNQQLVIY